MTSCELRLKAAEILEERGHCKWMLCDEETGRVCVNGALLLAAGAPVEKLRRCDWDIWLDGRSDAVTEAVKAMGFVHEQAGSGSTLESSVWNNKPERTQEEVIARLREGCDGI
jgi:hypothetical protein